MVPPGKAAIARFQNGAEAGFFADELARETGVDAEVLARERFDAVHAVWAIDYVLLAPEAHADTCARTLQSLVDATSDDETEEESAARSDLPAGVWMPLILTLAAGSIACFGVEHAHQRPRPPALADRDPRDPDLWRVLGDDPAPWTQRLEGGAGQRELSIDRETGTAVLREDHDGDGRFERAWRFRWRR